MPPVSSRSGPDNLSGHNRFADVSLSMFRDVDQQHRERHGYPLAPDLSNITERTRVDVSHDLCRVSKLPVQ